VVGGDYTFELVAGAARHYGRRVGLLALDAQSLPFVDASFDLVLCYEALYYFPDSDSFVAEAARVLRPGGELVVVNVNPAWSGFNPSPYSTRYHSARELAVLLGRHGFTADVRGAFPESEGGLVSRVTGMVRRIAVALHLVPKTMRAKRLLKRIFYGQLVSLPAELKEITGAPTLSTPGTDGQATVLYAVGRRTGA
jgi:SAM-dependent methyltransferase